MNSAPDDTAAPRARPTRRLVPWLCLGLAALLALGIWIVWSESHPDSERALRLAWRDQLTAWFPAEMQPSPRDHGLFLVLEDEEAALAVVLVHGLDEPGDIWHDLVATWRKEENFPAAVWELRYPNDQAIDRSAEFLARQWERLPADRPVVLLGHSMGGLVIREFVSRWRHPVQRASSVEGPPVRAAYLVGTPNHGSEWARLRVWLELRDQFANAQAREFSLFAALRDGVGTAKVDLRPGSTFLAQLNARPWPEAVELRLIAGVLLDRAPLQAGVEDLIARADDPDRARMIEVWWKGLRGQLGDGVVTVESVALEDFAPPLVLPASHRGLIRAAPLEPGTPPAIPLLTKWVEGAVPSASRNAAADNDGDPGPHARR
ncbi:MAG: esterase/lipase family protein [Opitutales bacterium]